MEELGAALRKALLDGIVTGRRMLRGLIGSVDAAARLMKFPGTSGSRSWVEQSWAKRLTELQREEILLHAVRLAAINHSEEVRPLAPELILADLVRDQGLSFWPILAHFLLPAGEEPERDSYPVFTSAQFSRLTAPTNDVASPFPAKRSARLIQESTLLQRHAFLIDVVKNAAVFIIQSVGPTLNLPSSKV